ncbi:MAG: DNA/RNA non-specific endonuclease [Bacteroidetes bacterium]|nr:DNA/RNA non-specific endonuclease [Bacteroidota bacterium]
MIYANRYFMSLALCLAAQLMCGQVNELMLTVKPGKDLTNKGTTVDALKNDTMTQHVAGMKELKHFLHEHSTTPHTDHDYTGHDIQLIHHPGYISAMHTRYNLPAWVAHAVTKYNLEHPQEGVKHDSSVYPSDPDYPALKGNAYQSSGYDHGHLAPAGDFRHDKTLYDDCFKMSNMSPQHGCLNQKGWCVLEDYCRIWTKEEAEGSVSYLVSGPVLLQQPHASVFIDSLCLKKGVTVYVPRYFFKAICLYNEQTKTARAIAFIVPNQELSPKGLNHYAVSIDELEELIDWDLFSTLPDKLEAATEGSMGHFNFSYESKLFECIDKDCEKVYGNRMKPEERKVLKCK